MEKFRKEQFEGKVLDHLGLVAATLKKLQIVEKIDARLPLAKGKGVKISMGERVAAMVLNGLGFIDDRLYLFPEFLKNKPVERLFGKAISAEDFNDDALGRCLDAIEGYGVTSLFTEIAFEIGIEQKLLGSSSHFDTSTLSVYGEYSEEEITDETREEPHDISQVSSSEETTQKKAQPAYGHAKNKRVDLKQMVINLATTGSAGYPIWMEAHSGNASDKVILQEAAQRMQTFCKQLKGASSFLYVGDSAMYANCIKYGKDMLWLSRVPENIKEVKALISRDESELSWEALDNGYKAHYVESVYGGVLQRWVLVYSEQAYTRESVTLEKDIKKEYSEYEKLFWHLSNEHYTCATDAQKAALELSKGLKYHCVSTQVTEIRKYTGKGRPKKGEQAEITGYKIEYKIEQDDVKIKSIRNHKGRFVLATNQLDKSILPNEHILTEYKAQSQTESGFKFIKDDTFELDSIFLKKPERICALMMIMTLCLMVYAVAQHDLRQSLANANETVPNQTGKETQTPTLKWIYRLFQGIQVLTIKGSSFTQTIVINVSERLEKIVRYFGEFAMQIYDVAPG